MGFLPTGAAVPGEKRTPRLLLRPLRAADVELDYDAVMSSRELLRNWSQSGWPAEGFTLAENLADLERHEREHLERVAFTFTVLDPAAAVCLGCVYIMPFSPKVAALFTTDAPAAQVGFWVRASEVAGDLDRHLLATLREWFRGEWAFERVVFTIGVGDARQAALLGEAGLGPPGDVMLPDGRRCRAFAEAVAPSPGSSRR